MLQSLTWGYDVETRFIASHSRFTPSHIPSHERFHYFLYKKTRLFFWIFSNVIRFFMGIGHLLFQRTKNDQGFFTVVAADQRFGSEPAAHFRPIGMFKNAATVIIGEMDAAGTCRLAFRHAGNGGGDGWGDATGTASGATFHDTLI